MLCRGHNKRVTIHYHTVLGLTSSKALLYYDHIITFPQEYRKVWKRPLSFINILFLANRYSAFFGYIPIMYFTFNSPMDLNVCLSLVVAVIYP